MVELLMMVTRRCKNENLQNEEISMCEKRRLK